MNDCQPLPTNPQAALARRYLDLLLRMDRGGASDAIDAALDSGVSLASIYLDVLAATQEEIGRRWERGELSVAQEHYCTAVSQAVMARIGAGIAPAPRGAPTLAAACVQGNQHEFGLRMVADFFAMRGWNTEYLGEGVGPSGIVAAAARLGAPTVALSASMASQVEATALVVKALRADARTSAVRVLVGGRAFNSRPRLWERVGADGHGADALAAVALATSALRNAA